MSKAVITKDIETGIKDDSSTEVLDVDENLHIIADPDAADYLGESVAEELQCPTYLRVLRT